MLSFLAGLWLDRHSHVCLLRQYYACKMQVAADGLDFSFVSEDLRNSCFMLLLGIWAQGLHVGKGTQTSWFSDPCFSSHPA